MAAIAKDGMLTKLPLVVILGATGTGKSKLAIQVAKRFGGEVISADAMQVYRGLDIVTNKVSCAELREAPHHMLDFLSPDQPSKVTDFRDRALPIIEELVERGKLPVVAGGTFYYVEALLWRILMAADSEEADEPAAKRRKCEEVRESAECARVRAGVREVLMAGVSEGEVAEDLVEGLDRQQKERLHQLLLDVDPDRANTLHPNDTRKVLRSLKVFQNTGRRHSELIREQKLEGNHLGGPLRYPDSVILWVTCQQDVLDTRLDSRVDEMMQQGLITELEEFHKEYNLRRMKEEDGSLKTPAYTLGIFQSIGFKEFHAYLTLSAEEKGGERGKELLRKGVELMKIATRQYARRQLKWIRKRFLGREQHQVPPVFALDGTDAAQWDSSVRDKAFSIIQSKLHNTPCPVEPQPVHVQVTDQKLFKCEECDRYITGSLQIEIHLNSQKHKRRLSRLAKEAAALQTANSTTATAQQLVEESTYH